MTDCWRGKRVAFTGRLASMDRDAARRLIANLGGKPSERVTRRTAALIIGSDGWPLRRSGKLTKNLRLAASLKRRGHPIDVLSESAFLSALGVTGDDDAVHRLYTVEQISELVQVSGLRLRRWIDAGMIRPQEIREGVALFSFRQVSSIRDLWRLVAGGCDRRTLIDSLRRLGRLLPESDRTLAEIQQFGKVLVTRTADGGLIDGYGQRLFSFEEERESESLSWIDSIDGSRDPDAAFSLASRLEAADSDQAIAAYEAWIDRFGSDPAALFNLANLLSAAGRSEEAIRSYRRAIEIDGDDPRLWNNLALALADCGRLSEASRTLDQALDRDPDYADAYFNAADILEQRGQLARARLMWRRYLDYDDCGEHADYARSRCGSTVTSNAGDS